MNYLRGAVNAISAPYQYYKDINPSTLTGAIDVIVIRRPVDNGGTELVCSPFHVRFGKWQVLRPSDKNVSVFVNGNPIPFDMKIGEAGEAFFVFETDEDVQADLITSPVLHPTVPTQEEDGEQPMNLANTDHSGAEEVGNEQEEQAVTHVEREPTFLDLNEGLHQELQGRDLRSTPTQTHFVPKLLRKQDSKSTISLPGDRFTEHFNDVEPQMGEQDQRIDEALTTFKAKSHIPEVEYRHDVTLDMEGYKLGYHDREASDRTLRSASPSSSQQHNDEDYSKRPSLPPSHSTVHLMSQTQSEINSPYIASPLSTPSLSSSLPGSPSESQSHLFRATSEPPPEIQVEDDTHPSITIVAPQSPSIQDYSWEWGAFPQPSPLKASFGKGGRFESPISLRKSERKERPVNTFLTPGSKPDEWTEEQRHGTHGRSRSVPPMLDGTPPKQKGRQYNEYEDFESQDGETGEEEIGRRTGSFFLEDLRWISDCGATLNASRDDASLFVFPINDKKVLFQLSLVSFEDVKDGVQLAQLFNKHLIEFERFLDDESVIQDPRLVIRWGEDHYIWKEDSSLLMDTLVHWRNATLEKRAEGGILRPVSPPANLEGSVEHKPADKASGDKKDAKDPDNKPIVAAETKSVAEAGKMSEPPIKSWAQWWSSSRKNRVDRNAESTSNSSISLPLPSSLETEATNGRPLDARSEPATPLQRPADIAFEASAPAVPACQPTKTKKFVKTLRLTSDQLESLNLKLGANSITFSLSASGASATTARIFVWDSTDLVVISDIDGTITKSDGLGHVFAMIGRDWTHSGVAKLYTDIVRNGYKILYLTSRPIGQADSTRFYLRGIKQNNHQLPDGPVIMSPDRLIASLHREVIMRKPEVFKMACLRDIQRLFAETLRNPFYAGFGNRITDALSYRSVNVPSARIFTIDHTGEVKMELLELAGYKSSYIHMTDLVDQIFPPIHRKWTVEFTDFNYWKAPVQDFPLPDLSPPSSPALSARSDTSGRSTFARLRNFTLTGPKQQQVITQGSVASNPDKQEANGHRNSHLRQMSSFERFSSTLGFVTRSATPKGDPSRRSVSVSSSSSSVESDDDDDELDAEERGRKLRRRSMTSMPGTLDETHFDMGDEEYEQKDNHDARHFIHGEDFDDVEQFHLDAEEEAEAAFDEDLFATGAMQNVPFL